MLGLGLVPGGVEDFLQSCWGQTAHTARRRGCLAAQYSVMLRHELYCANEGAGWCFVTPTQVTRHENTERGTSVIEASPVFLALFQQLPPHLSTPGRQPLLFCAPHTASASVSARSRSGLVASLSILSGPDHKNGLLWLRDVLQQAHMVQRDSAAVGCSSRTGCR
jgi:hypothetical protein